MNRTPYLRVRLPEKSRPVGRLEGGQHLVLSLPIDYRETPKRKTSFWAYCCPGRRMPLG